MFFKIYSPLVLVAILMAGCAVDTAFESSDGSWHASTIEWKGYGFESVLYAFECHKFQVKDPHMVLYRTTKTPSEWNLFWSKSDRSNAKWKVPYRAPLSCASSDDYNDIGPYTTMEQCQELYILAKTRKLYYENLPASQSCSNQTQANQLSTSDAKKK